MIQKIISLNLKQKRVLIAGIILLIIGQIVFEYVFSRYSIAITKPDHVCFPYRVWFIDKTAKKLSHFNYDDYIAFVGSNIPYTREGVTFVKKIAGLSGDIVETKKIEKGEETKNVLIKGEIISKDIQALVFLKNRAGGTYLLEVLATDSKNRRVPVIDSVVIPEGKFFAFSPHERSYDSRYWGLVDESQIIGKAYPIF